MLKRALSKCGVVCVLFLLVFCIYNANLRPIAAYDSVPAALMPLSILLDKTITLDRFYDWYRQNHQIPLYFFALKGSHVYSAYSIALPLMITPLYMPIILILDVAHWPVEKIVTFALMMEKVSASLIASLSVAVFFCLLRRLVDNKQAAVLSLTYALGTSTWTISSQALWQHGMCQLMIISSLYFLQRASEGRENSGIALSGLFAGIGAAVRPMNIAFAASVLAYGLLTKWQFKRLLLFGATAIALACLPFVYNYLVFNNVTGIYTGHTFGTDLFAGLGGVLLSPGRGLFIFTPVSLFIFVGVYAWFKGDRRSFSHLYMPSLIYICIHVIMVSKYWAWWGGYTYGPRYLTEITPCLVLLMIPGLRYFARSSLIKAGFTLLLVASVIVQAIGAFHYPRGLWDFRPVDIGAQPSRLWDWTDNPILRSALAGPELGPHLSLVGLVRPLKDDEFRAVYGGIEGPGSLKAGSSATFRVLVSNSSGTTWFARGDTTGSQAICLAYHWYTPSREVITYDGIRSPLPFFLRPAASAVVSTLVIAPEKPGTYVLAFDLVQEHVAWFSSKGVKPAELVIDVVNK